MTITLPILFFTFVVLAHAIAIIYAQYRQSHPYHWRKRFWQLHFWINGSLWFLLVVMIVIWQFRLPHNNHPLLFQVIGIGFSILGLTLIINAFLILGLDRVMGHRFFFPEKDKQIRSILYKFLNNPMYDGLILLLVGSGLVFGFYEDFYLAIASFVLMNIFLATIENQGYKWKPF